MREFRDYKFRDIVFQDEQGLTANAAPIARLGEFIQSPFDNLGAAYGLYRKLSIYLCRELNGQKVNKYVIDSYEAKFTPIRNRTSHKRQVINRKVHIIDNQRELFKLIKHSQPQRARWLCNKFKRSIKEAPEGFEFIK